MATSKSTRPPHLSTRQPVLDLFRKGNNSEERGSAFSLLRCLVQSCLGFFFGVALAGAAVFRGRPIGPIVKDSTSERTTPAEDLKGPAMLVVEGVTGKRIRKVSLEEAGADLPDMAYLAVEFDDDTELQFNVGVRSQLVFAVSHNARGEDDEMEPVNRLDEATIRSLVKQQKTEAL